VSILVKMRLKRLGLKLSHEERKELDRLLIEKTGEKDCDEAVKKVSDEQFIKLVNEAIQRVKSKKPIYIQAT